MVSEGYNGGGVNARHLFHPGPPRRRRRTGCVSSTLILPANILLILLVSIFLLTFKRVVEGESL